MLPEDIAIWRRFLERFEDQFEEYTYDTLVGPRYDWGEFTLTPEMQGLAERLYALRIDVLAKRPGEWWVIEVKPLAGLSAFGQVLAYEFYLSRNLPPLTVLRKLVVTDAKRHYMPPLWAHYNVWGLILPPDGEPELVPPGQDLIERAPVEI